MGCADTAVRAGRSGRQEEWLSLDRWEGRGDQSEVSIEPLSALLLFTWNNQPYFPFSYDWNSAETS